MSGGEPSSIKRRIMCRGEPGAGDTKAQKQVLFRCEERRFTKIPVLLNGVFFEIEVRLESGRVSSNNAGCGGWRGKFGRFAVGDAAPRRPAHPLLGSTCL